MVPQGRASTIRSCVMPVGFVRTERAGVGVRTVYSPTIEETWKRSGISRLKTDGVLDHKWQEPLEAVVYNAGKYLS